MTLSLWAVDAGSTDDSCSAVRMVGSSCCCSRAVGVTLSLCIHKRKQVSSALWTDGVQCDAPLGLGAAVVLRRRGRTGSGTQRASLSLLNAWRGELDDGRVSARGRRARRWLALKEAAASASSRLGGGRHCRVVVRVDQRSQV